MAGPDDVWKKIRGKKWFLKNRRVGLPLKSLRSPGLMSFCQALVSSVACCFELFPKLGRGI